MPDESAELMHIARVLVFRIAACSFGGALPENNFCTLEAILSILPPEMSAERKDEAKPYLFAAICEYRAAQNRLPL